MAEEVKNEETAVESGKTFAAFLVKNGNKEEKAKDKDGKTKIGTTLTLKNYRDFLTSQGITKEILEKQASVETEVTDGINRYNGDVLSAKVEELVKAGKTDDAKAVESSVSVTTPLGTRKVTAASYKKYPIPSSDEKVEKGYVITDDYKMTKSVTKSIVADYEANLKKLLGI